MHVEKIKVKGKVYFRLVHNLREGQKIIHRSKYLGSVLPSKVKLEELEKDFLQELHRPEAKNRELKRLRTMIIAQIKKEGIVRAGIFGSYARGEQTPKSDIDLLVGYRKRSKKSLLDLTRLQRELSEKLGKKVDLVTYQSLSPYLKERILKEEVKVL